MSVQSFVLLYGLPFLALSVAARQPTTALFTPFQRSHVWLLAWLAVGIAIRLPLLWDTGFHYDTGTYKAWALKLSDPAAPLHIYEEGYFADYPPLYMYVLAALGGLARLFGLDSTVHFTAVIKTPALLCDVVVAALLYRHAPVGNTSHATRWRSIAALAYWLNPAIIFDGALWGQTESILALLLLAAWLQWRAGRFWLASIALGAAVAFKPQGLVFAYVYGLSLLVSQPLRITLQQAAVGLLSFAVIIAPFAYDQTPDWIFKLYFSTAATYDYLSVNAYNFWALWGGNWSKDAGSFLGIAAQIWAMILAGATLTSLGIYTGLRLRAADTMQQRSPLMLWAFALATLLFFMLAPRMHERYILPLLPLLILLGHRAPVRWLVMAWTMSSLANLGYVYYHYVDLAGIAPADTGFVRAVSLINVVLMLLTFVAWRWPEALNRLGTGIRDYYARLPAIPQVNLPREKAGLRHCLPYIVLCSFALGLGTFQLGSQNTPLSGALIDIPVDITLIYGEEITPKRALIFAGEGAGKIMLEQKRDREWVTVIAEMDVREFYKLHEITLTNVGAARVLRLRVTEVEQPLRINEFGVLDAAGNALLPRHVTGKLAEREKLIDEAQTLVAGQGYLTSTYFDEIYHARTAHEYLHRLSIYETTHPPLGKWLISQGIFHFGMTPWGMRIVGVLATVGIVAALIWGAWLLTGSARVMWLAGLLGLFEFSRYAIGRYSTIDSFLILFLLIAALSLWRVFAKPQNWLQGWRLSPGLLLAGASLGLAIATKWSALYFGIGLFGFYVYSLLKAYRSTAVGTPAIHQLLLGPSLALGLIPLLVYLWSYVPFLRCLPHAPDLFSVEGLRQIWKSQIDMYNYHSQLESTHAFSSAYYTWPLALKPLWLYVSDTQAPLRSSITLMGNPVIWWGGLIALIALLGKRLAWATRDRVWLIGSIAALYLPWAAVSRASFIYHYYPIVPLMILLLAVTLARLPQQSRLLRALPWTIAGLSGVLFILFYPAISGYWIPSAWFKWLHWLPGWWML